MKEEEFKGVQRDCAPHAVDPGFFQEDQGGDRFFRGVWRRRRGMLRSDLAKFSAVPRTVISFETPGEDFAMVIVEGVNIQGFTNVGDQSF